MRLLSALLLSAALHAQNAKPLTFDAASVKPATPPDGVTVNGGAVTMRKGSGIALPRNTGGPGTDDPGRIHYPMISLKSLLLRAWDSYYEIAGPDWLDTQVVQVDATMPPDTTQAQFQEMLRNLITERFQLKHHTETKQVTGYSLTVAKNGPKLKESVIPPGPPQADDSSWRTAYRDRPIGPDGFRVPPPRPGAWCMMEGATSLRSRVVCQQEPIGELAKELGFLLKGTVTDATGLTGKYDLALPYGGNMAPGGAIPKAETAPSDDSAQLPDIFTAIQSQLGLKLEPKKAPVEVFVVDHMAKTPSGN